MLDLIIIRVYSLCVESMDSLQKRVLKNLGVVSRPWIKSSNIEALMTMVPTVAPFESDFTFAFGQARLSSIVDLSPAGHQPMFYKKMRRAHLMIILIHIQNMIFL